LSAVGAPSFASYAKGGSRPASYQFQRCQPTSKPVILTLSGAEGEGPLHFERRGCPILRVLCEGWEPCGQYHKSVGAPSFAFFAKGGSRAVSTINPRVPHPSRSFAKGGNRAVSTINPWVPHPSRSLRRVGAAPSATSFENANPFQKLPSPAIASNFFIPVPPPSTKLVYVSFSETGR